MRSPQHSGANSRSHSPINSGSARSRGSRLISPVKTRDYNNLANNMDNYNNGLEMLYNDEQVGNQIGNMDNNLANNDLSTYYYYICN